MKRRTTVILALLVVMMLTTGCYWRRQVEEYEVGLHLHEGTKLTNILGPGRHSNWGYQNSLEIINVSAINDTWEDPELVTRDKQPVSFSVFYAFARKRDDECVRMAWSKYNKEARDDEALKVLVKGKLPRVIKAVTTKYKLDQMLGIEDIASAGEQLDTLVNTYGRQVVEREMGDLYEEELNEICVELLDIGINNIGPDPDYMFELKEKALQQIRTEVAEEKKKQLEVQVKQEEAQTLVDLEIAKRQRLVAEERAKVYETNPGWLQLQIWEAAKEVFAGDNVWFIDPNADLTLLFGAGNKEPIPINAP